MFQQHLIGYWPLHGDCLDHSGNGHHGQNHGVDLDQALFNGLDSYISVPSSPALDLHGDFTLTAWIRSRDGPLMAVQERTRMDPRFHGDDRLLFAPWRLGVRYPAVDLLIRLLSSRCTTPGSFPFSRESSNLSFIAY